MDRLPRWVQQFERTAGITAETLALFVRFWLTITPPLPNDAHVAAQIEGRERLDGFTEAFGPRLQKGQSLLHEIRDDTTGIPMPAGKRESSNGVEWQAWSQFEGRRSNSEIE